MSSWLDQIVSFYTCQADNTGRPASIRDILFTLFAVAHQWFYKSGDEWISGQSNDLTTIIDLRSGVLPQEEKTRLKATLQCWTPAALLETKKKGQVKEIHRTGIMQLDFDACSLVQYDIDEVMAMLFDLPFIGFVSRSCSGTGIYALALIEEPEKLTSYAMHCFDVLDKYGLKPDTSKGRNPQDLRYVSYDANMMVKENPVPLRIKRFKPPSLTSQSNRTNTPAKPVNGSKALIHAIEAIRNAPVGNRFPTVQKWAYSLGGTQDDAALDQIKEAILNSSQYAGVTNKYLQAAIDCFNDGKLKPFQL